jgi:cell division protein FtsB
VKQKGYGWLVMVLLCTLGYLQYRLWVGPGSIPAGQDMLAQIDRQHQENLQLDERNKVLEAEIVELKSGMETVEERARRELVMIKSDETLFIIPE